MSRSAYAWFWQPPLDGKPGLLMISDEHPGIDRPDVPFVIEDIKTVLVEIEAKLPADVQFHELRVFERDIVGVWVEIQFGFHNAYPRRYRFRAPKIKQGDLIQLWESRL